MRILLVGDIQSEEFADAIVEMQRACEVVAQPSVALACDWLEAGETTADLIVVAQSRPGQIAATAIESLRRAAPLAPLVALLGSWCEGETRSGAPWPSVPRVYWHQWPGRFRQEVARLAKGDLSTWNLPSTATAEERLLAAKDPLKAAMRGVAAIVSPNAEQADWLAIACRQGGLQAVVFQQTPAGAVDGIDVLLWDAGLTTPGLIDDFQRLAACYVGSPVLVLLDFPRDDDVRQLTTAGAGAVLAKPLSLADLIAQIDRALASKDRS